MAREYAGTFLTEFAVLLSQVIVYKLAAKYLGQMGFSEYALARRTVGVLYPIVLLGHGVGLPRYVAQANGRGDVALSNRYLGATILSVGGVSLVFLVFLNAFPHVWASLFFGSSDYSSLVAPLSLLVVGLGIHAVAYGYFRGILKMRAANFLQFMNMGVVPLLVFSFCHRSVSQLLIVLGVSTLATAVLALLFTPWVKGLSDNRLQLKELLKFGIQRVPGDFVHMALFALPAILVAHTSGVAKAGYVAFSISMLNLVGSFFSPFGLILLPRASTLLASGNSEELRHQVWTLAKITFVVSAVISLAIGVGADKLIGAYLGPGFIEASGIVRLMLLAAVPYSLYVLLRNVIDAFHELGMTTLILTCGLLTFLLASASLLFIESKLYAVVGSFVLGIMSLWFLSSFETIRILRATSSPRWGLS